MPRRLVNISSFLFCAGVLGYAYYLQLQQDLAIAGLVRNWIAE